MKQKILLSIMIIVTVLVVLSCSKQEDTKGASLSELAGSDWDTIIAQGSEEAKVVWYIWYFQDQFRQLSQDFTDTYGIEVVIPDGTHDANTNKVVADKGKEKGDIDVIATGTDNYALLLGGQDLLFGPLTFIPKVDTRVSNLSGIDTKGNAFAYWGNQTGFAYDPKRISKSELPQTIPEFEKWLKDNPKLFGLSDPNGGSSGLSFVRALISNLNPNIDYANATLTDSIQDSFKSTWTWFNDRSAQFVIAASNADALTRLNDGEFVMVAAWEDHMANLQKQGAINRNLEFYIPEFGMDGGGSFVGIPSNAPHPAAAILFVEWLTSAKTQTLFNQTFGTVPRNTEADDSHALVPTEMRKYSTERMDVDVELEIKKEFVEKVILKK